MHLSFTPAIGETVRAEVPASIHPSSAVQLRFSAILSPEDYAELVHDGVKVQVWSDIPTHGRKAGEWGAMDFEAPPAHDHIASNTTKFSLLPSVAQQTSHDIADDQKITLSLKFTILSPEGPSQFSLTYRLLYPSGEIKWLGQYGQNGALLLEPSQAHLSFASERWSEAKDGSSWSTQVRSPEDNLEVARFTKTSDYSIWNVQDNSVSKSSTQRSTLIFVVPHAVHHSSVLLPHSFVLGASPGACLTLTSDGVVKAFGDGSLLLETYDAQSELHAFVGRLRTHCASSTHRLLNSEPNSNHHVVVAQGTCPVSAWIIPIYPSLSPNTDVGIGLHELAALLPTGSSRLSIASHANSNSQVFATPAEGASHEIVSFTVNSSTGGQFVVSPVYELSTRNGDWQISVTTPYSPVTPPVEQISLPTPPPSPRLRPVAHLTEASTLSSDISVPSLREEAGVADVAPSNDNGDDDDGADDDEEEEEEEAYTNAEDEDTPTTVGVSIKAYFQDVLRLAALFWSTFLDNIFDLFRSSDASAEEEGDVDEHTPLLQRGQPVIEDAEEVEEVEEIEEIEVTAETPSATAIEETAEAIPEDVPGVIIPVTKPPQALFLDTPGGKVSITLRNATSGATVDQVIIQLNGKPVELTVSQNGDGHYIEFDAGSGGRIKITS